MVKDPMNLTSLMEDIGETGRVNDERFRGIVAELAEVAPEALV